MWHWKLSTLDHLYPVEFFRLDWTFSRFQNGRPTSSALFSGHTTMVLSVWGGTTHTFWYVTALWNKSCSIKRWTVHPFAWCASFVIALNPFVCVHLQHTDSIKLLFIHNPPPMMLGSPTTPATANQFINMTSSSNPVQQPKTTSASRSNLPGMYSWQNPQVYYDF